MVAAALRGDLDAIRQKIAEGADPNELEIELRSAIEVALESGDADRLRRTTRTMRELLHPHEHARRAIRIADSLGERGSSTSAENEDGEPIAWGYYLSNVSAAEGRGLALGVSRARSTIVMLAAPEEQSFSAMILAREIARHFPDELVEGRRLNVGRIAAENRAAGGLPAMKAHWELRNPRSVFTGLDVEDALFAVPVGSRTCAVQIDIDAIERSLERWQHFMELDAPSIIVEGELKLVRRSLESLRRAGVDPNEELDSDRLELLHRALGSAE